MCVKSETFTEFYRPGIAFQKQCILLAFTFQEESIHYFYTLYDLIVQSQEPAVIAMTGRLHLASQDLALGKDHTVHSI